MGVKRSSRRTDPGWKSDIEKHIRLSGWKRPLGVSIYTAKGFPDQSGEIEMTAMMGKTAYLDSRWFEWVLRWEEEDAMVFTPSKR